MIHPFVASRFRARTRTRHTRRAYPRAYRRGLLSCCRSPLRALKFNALARLMRQQNERCRAAPGRPLRTSISLSLSLWVEMSSANSSILTNIDAESVVFDSWSHTHLMLGAPATAIAEHWEKANRVYELRDFMPDNYRQPTAPVMPTGPDLDRWAKGRALLFIHGTFSNAHGGFYDLPPEFMAVLHRRYGGRVLAFNHFTMAHDPEQNVRWFAEAIRPMSAGMLDVDVVCHSPGGLMARTLAEGRTLFGLDLGRCGSTGLRSSPCRTGARCSPIPITWSTCLTA
jgi:hypothetical protein